VWSGSPESRRAIARWRRLLVSLVVCAAPAHAGDAYREEVIKAAFLYRFTGYVEWPQDALESRRFTIAVLGSPEVAGELSKLTAQRLIKNLPARVRSIDSVADADDALVLYVGSQYVGDLGPLIRKLDKRPILVVTDSARGLDDGGTVNFVLVDRRVRFEVSLPAAQRAGIRLSSELLSVATRVLGSSSSLENCFPVGPPQSGIDCVERVARQ
jgi:hypothetical protein